MTNLRTVNLTTIRETIQRGQSEFFPLLLAAPEFSDFYPVADDPNATNPQPCSKNLADVAIGWRAHAISEARGPKPLFISQKECQMTMQRPTPTISRRTTLAALAGGGLGLAMLGGSRAAFAQDATPASDTEITLVPLGYGLPVMADGYALSLARVTFPVGVGDMPHTHPGAAIVAVESGVMAMTPLQGEAAVTRAGAAGAEPMDLDVEVILNPGDAVFFTGEHGDVNQNVGDTPLVFLVAALYAADQPPITFMAAPEGTLETGTPAT